MSKTVRTELTHTHISSSHGVSPNAASVLQVCGRTTRSVYHVRWYSSVCLFSSTCLFSGMRGPSLSPYHVLTRTTSRLASHLSAPRSVPLSLSSPHPSHLSLHPPHFSPPWWKEANAVCTPTSWMLVKIKRWIVRLDDIL